MTFCFLETWTGSTVVIEGQIRYRTPISSPRGASADPDTEASLQSTVTEIPQVLFGSVAAPRRLDGLIK